MGILDGIFKDKENQTNKEIESLNVAIKEKELEIQRLKIEVQTMRESYMPPKQLEIMEKNLKSLREENNKLKKENDEMTKKLKFLENSFSLDIFLYKLSVDEFFSAAKFNAVRAFLAATDIKFIQDMESVISSPEFIKVKNSASALKKYIAFRDKGEITWDNRVALCKGDRVQKIFKKSRKFTNYLSDNNIEFMDDMSKFNFDELAVKGGFTTAVVEELKEMTEEYFDIYKIG